MRQPTFPTMQEHGELKGQLLKWIGNKQRFAKELISYFPSDFNRYVEPFIGSGAVLATLGPKVAFAGDAFGPLIEIWTALKEDPGKVVAWYQERHDLIDEMGKAEAYKFVLQSYNQSPNGPDLLFLSRTCYGGVIRFRKHDGYMSTPCGPHRPMPPGNFADRAYAWHKRVRGTTFYHADFRELMQRAEPGDLVYCDPPYVDSQSILYGAQSFQISDLFDAIAACKQRGVYVALSIDGTKKSGGNLVKIDPPVGLFEREAFVNCGRSMLRRFQMDGQTLEAELVADRLLLTY